MARNHLIILPLLALALVASATLQNQPQGHRPQYEHSPQHWRPQCFCVYYPTYKCCKKPQLPECHKPKHLPTWTHTYNKCVNNCGLNLHCIDYCQNRFHRVPYFPKCDKHQYGHYGYKGYQGQQGHFQGHNQHGYQGQYGQQCGFQGQNNYGQYGQQYRFQGQNNYGQYGQPYRFQGHSDQGYFQGQNRYGHYLRNQHGAK